MLCRVCSSHQPLVFKTEILEKYPVVLRHTCAIWFSSPSCLGCPYVHEHPVANCSSKLRCVRGLSLMLLNLFKRYANQSGRRRAMLQCHKDCSCTFAPLLLLTAGRKQIWRKTGLLLGLFQQKHMHCLKHLRRTDVGKNGAHFALAKAKNLPFPLKACDQLHVCRIAPL